jgi:hypothetical protein
MGNTNSSNSAPPSPSRWGSKRQNSTTKQVHISTDHTDGFYFTGERLTGTVKLSTSFVHHQRQSQTPTESLKKRSLRSAILIELVGDATYSSEVDVAADSDGHSSHKVNVCRQRCIVTINPQKAESETAIISSPLSPSTPTPPALITGTFQLDIPDDLPPSLTNSRTPSVVYTLELSFSSTRNRYQIPIILSSRGGIPHPMRDIELNDNVISKTDIRFSAYSPRSFYRPGEQIPVRINYSNPQQRFIRSITIRLLQFYRIHNDENHLQLDGKEWTFDVPTIIPQREWSGEAHLQLPNQPLQASYSTNSVGTTQNIQCELDYRILIELYEKKGDDIHLTLSPIQVTYQK